VALAVNTVFDNKQCGEDTNFLEFKRKCDGSPDNYSLISIQLSQCVRSLVCKRKVTIEAKAVNE